MLKILIIKKYLYLEKKYFLSAKDYGYTYDIATCMYDSVVRKILNECKCEPTFASGINQVKK